MLRLIYSVFFTIFWSIKQINESSKVYKISQVKITLGAESNLHFRGRTNQKTCNKSRMKLLPQLNVKLLLISYLSVRLRLLPIQFPAFWRLKFLHCSLVRSNMKNRSNTKVHSVRAWRDKIVILLSPSCRTWGKAIGAKLDIHIANKIFKLHETWDPSLLMQCGV